ncbi:hypothetical protein FYJ32_05555 [Bifidobacterium tsurumiense]|uniref:sugar ABC transporter substrate-binding protein n=2 Tax=Bifidobacterium tsurumiense TaxID=356829 RepID=UPI0012B34753|nr:sugar ABC transporter substrate-binding protein [Bifidobacterium tsurumiense]MDY4677672.1 hypothetical protein [Bifidobacterium tsurumiense]MSS12914.1 hypothetical protein [Bifidobacterium tsurumiense]
MRRSLITRWLMVFVLCMLAITSACTPQGSAVGRTQSDSSTAIHHDGIDRSDMLVGLIGGKNDDAADANILKSCQTSQLKAVYVSTSDVVSYAQAAQQGMIDLAARPVSVVAVNHLDLQGQTASTQDWRDAFEQVRQAGIPVVLIDPIDVPQDDTLYAAVFVTDDQSEGNAADHDSDSTSLGDALMLVANDNPHDVRMTVRL